ncbi:MAG TPA: hypothetical protein VE010_22915 [Thermoanaerobaculia bacterium]|nr:hypothetical protein [Thermoanaerobaculia bacterium]
MDLIPIVGIISSSVMIVLIVYFVTRGRQRRVEAQVEMQTRLIDRFGSASELVEFLHSPAGRQFVTGVDMAPALMTRERLMSGFSRAIILTALGIAFVCLSFLVDDDFVVPASILLSLGIGYLVATFVSYKLAAKLMSDPMRQS